MVETFAADAADNSFTIRVLPGRAWCGWDFFNTHAFDTLPERVPVDAVAITSTPSFSTDFTSVESRLNS